MAVDDNTSYELTGAQVKDLAAKIKSKAADNAFTGATSAVAGVKGIVPEPQAGDDTKYLKGDGTWATIVPSLVEMSYGESNAWAKFSAAYAAGSIVYCRASSNPNPATGTQGRKAFMAYVNNATSPTEVEFQYVRSVSSKTDSQQSDQVFIYKLTNASGGTWTVTTRNMATKIDVDSTLNKTYTSGANASVSLGAKAMTGATSGAAGTAGIVPAPAAGKDASFLRGDATWAIPAQAAMSGIWTNTTTLPSTGSVAHTTVDVTSMSFSSKDDYIVVTVNQGGGSNDPFTSIIVPDGYKSATSFRIELWNCHWASGAISSGTKIQWAVFRLN